MEVSQQELSQLIGSIYDCTLDPSKWEAVLSQIVAMYDCHNAVLTLTDIRYDRLLMYRSVGLDEKLRALQDKHIPEINAQLSQALASWPSLDRPFVLVRDLPPEYMENSAYIQEALIPSGIADILQYFLIGSPKRFAGLAFGSQKVFSDSDLEFGALLLPHVRRAVMISDVLDVRAVERAQFTAAMDALRCSVILTNADGRVVYANRSAERMLKDGTYVRSRHEVVRAVLPSASGELGEAVKLAARGDVQIGKTGLTVRLSEDGTSPVIAHVLPLAGTEFRSRLEPEAVAAIFIREREDVRDNAELIGTTYELTPAETRVLSCLLAGRSLPEAASELRVATSTVRTHLDVIFRKTGVNRQSELLLLASQISAPV
jgi:DNA-binding NarL/FixJ family response regulator/PAS domain-containing protein